MSTVLLATLLTAALPPDCGHDQRYGLLVPLPQTVDAPTNTVVWISAREPRGVLVDVTESPWKKVDASETSVADLTRIEPRAPLVAGHRYEIREGEDVTDPDRSARWEGFVASSDRADVMQPAPSLVSTGAPSPRGDCIQSGLEVALDREPLLALARVGGAVVARSTSKVLSIEAATGQAADAEVVTLDRAGRESAPLMVRGTAQARTWVEGAGCAGPMGCACLAAAPPPSASAMATIAVFATLGLIRMRNRRR